MRLSSGFPDKPSSCRWPTARCWLNWDRVAPRWLWLCRCAACVLELAASALFWQYRSAADCSVVPWHGRGYATLSGLGVSVHSGSLSVRLCGGNCSGLDGNPPARDCPGRVCGLCLRRTRHGISGNWPALGAGDGSHGVSLYHLARKHLAGSVAERDHFLRARNSPNKRRN